MEFNEAKSLLISKIKELEIEHVSIDTAYNRILSSDLIAKNDVPSFNRSPFDGYCFRSIDTIGASENNRISFDIIEEVPCGYVASKKLDKYKSIKILTGSKLPDGADSVIKYEDVDVQDKKVILKNELKANQNVILVGEDVRRGALLANKGKLIDMGVVGIAASLNISNLSVYKKLKVGLITTGSELIEIGEDIVDGKIYNSNRYIFEYIFNKYNIDCNYYGIVDDDIEKLKKVFETASNECDIVVSTGGVSVGDYDLVDRALKELGFDVFVKGIDMKPGMACCFAENKGKIVLALSGNPMSSVTTFYAVCLPAIRKMMGYSDFENKYFKVKLKNTFSKKIGKLRFLRANVDIEDGVAVANLNLDQGNIVIKSLIACNAMVKVENGAEVKEGMMFDCMWL